MGGYMSSMTMHGIDPDLDQRLRNEAAAWGLSLNQTLKKILSSAVGLDSVKTDHRQDYVEFCGIWSAQDEADFNRAISSCDQVDSEDWS
jgi:hypothetical protein